MTKNIALGNLMPEFFDKHVSELITSGKTAADAYAIARAEFEDSAIKMQFSDFASYSDADKTAISVRDGVLEYLGVELNLEPKDKVFTVYRSPATIGNASYGMGEIPLTDEHVSLDMPPPDTGSKVVKSEMIDQIDEATSSRLAIKNKLAVSDAMKSVLESKRQLSLGYHAELVPHSRWDYEQINIVPHHLAAVENGRCGHLCSFIDKKPTSEEDNMTKLHEAFLDADGAVNLEQVMEIAAKLPEAIKKVPVDQLKKLVPSMQGVMSYAQEQGAMPEEVMDEDPDEEEIEVADMDEMKDEDAKEEEKKFSDSDFKAALVKQSQAFADQEVKRFSEVINKARNFLDSSYDFTGKTSNEVMREALATQSTEKFEDSELAIAFKLLRKSADYSQFGDSAKPSALESRIQSDLEG
jgi:hypothetical protein